MTETSSSTLATDKLQTTPGSSFTEQSEDERDEKFMGDKFQNFGWKAVLLLQFQPQFEMVIMIAIYVSYVCSLLDFAYAFATKDVPNWYKPMGNNLIFCFDAIYAVDIILMIMYKNVKWIEMQHLCDERHALLVVLDIISTIPIDAIYYSLTETYMKIIYALRIRYTLRIFRFFRKLHYVKNTVGVNHLFIELLHFCISFTLLLVTVSCIWYLLECETQCSYPETLKMKKAFYVMTGKITSKGYPIFLADSTKLFFLYVLTNFISFVYISGFVVGLFLIALIQQYKTKFLSKEVRDLLLEKTRKANVKDEFIWTTLRLFFHLFWKHRKSTRFDHFSVKIVPEIMTREMSLDISWDALKHSHLFRDSEVYFLRFLAPYMKQTFMIPGESIYRRKTFKSAMVYIVSGVIQILSEEDSETPILSFSGGTCIGESTLLVDYPSTCSVVCQSYCETYVLHKRDFMKVILKYPEECRIMLRNIKDRYKEARDFQRLLDFTYKESKRKREVVKLKWLKITLHELMTQEREVEKTLVTSEDKRTGREFNQLVFCCNYLDMLVIFEQIDLITDTVFLQTGCPCILQPDSFVITTWTNIIFIAIFIFSFVYPFFASFFPEITMNYLMFSYVISFLWILDVYINISTGIRTKEGIVTEIKKIIMHRFQGLEFVVDVLAAFPLELFAVLLTGTVSRQTFVLLQSPRLLKMYRIGRFFDESLTTFNVMVRTYFKYIIYTILLLYYVSALLYLKICYNFVCDQTDNIFTEFINLLSGGKVINIIMVCLYLATQQLTTLGSLSTGNVASFYIEIIVVEFIMIFFYVVVLSNIAATEALKQINNLKISELTTSVVSAMENRNVNPRLCRAVFLHIQNQLQYNAGTDILYPPATLSYHVHPYLIREIRRIIYVPWLKRITLFMDWPQDLLANLAGVFFVNVLMPDETLTYSGELCVEMHIIIEGFCAMYSSSDKTPKVIGPGYSISLIEMCCGIPIVNNVVTLTHCKFFSIKHNQFMRELRRYPELLRELKDIAKSVLETANAEIVHQEDFDDYRQVSKIASSETSSFKHFGYNLDLKTREGAEYHSPFDKLGIFGFLRYLFMRHAIRSYGKFIRYWEISRCIFAFLTALLTPIGALTTCRSCGWNYILAFLDLTAWIDIYLKHHICYFNKEGIEITHPLKTAVYYWKHGFLIDILAVLPFEFILKPVVHSKVKNQSRIFLQSIRILQFYRIVRGIQFLNKDLISPSHLWTVTKYIPIFIIVIHTLAMIVMNVRCEFDPNIEASAEFTGGIDCKNSWIAKTTLSKPLTPMRAYFLVLLVTTLITTGPNIGGYSRLEEPIDTVNISVVALIGYFLFIHLSAGVISTNLFRNTDLRAYQEDMRDLVRFLSYRHIDPKLKREVIDHFEHVWRLKKGKSLHKLLKNFNNALQENILLDLYGKAMKKSAVFAEASNSFFRSILLYVKHDHVMRQGIITRVNDVHNRMHFLLKGQVEVLGPDYNRLLVLPIGSVFGHIDDCVWSRQSLTMVAKSHVEFLTIETTVFYKILFNYPRLNRHFRQLLAINTDYLLGAAPVSYYEDSLTTLEARATSSAPSKISTALNIAFTNFKYVYATVLWQNIILVLVCYIGFIAELIQMTVQDHAPEMLAFLYFLDLLLVVDMYLKFRTAYEDEFGVLITDKRQIALRFIKDLHGFPMYFASVVPLEILAFIFLGSKITWNVWSYLRCNRFIRILFVMDYLRKKTRQLNVNVSLIRTLGLLLWVTLLLQVSTSIILTAICTNPEYHARPVLNCNWNEMSRSEKFDTFKTRFAFVISVFTSTSVRDFFPNSEFLCFLIIAFVISSKFIFTYIVAEIAATLDIMLHNRMKYEEDIDAIKEHLVREHTSPALLDRIWLYLRVLWKRKNGLQSPSLLLDAPTYLGQGVLNAMFGFHLRKHKIFGQCHTDIIRQIAGKLHTRTYFPDDYITFVNDSDECMYFIHQGAVDVLSEDDLYSEKIDKVLYKDDMFGFEQGLKPHVGHEYTYRANRHSLILVLRRGDWIHLLDFFPASKKLIFSKIQHM